MHRPVALLSTVEASSNWLLGQEDEVPDYFVSGTDFLLVDCSDDIAADAEGTVSGIVDGEDVGSAADIP
jgi:hypothetical protein